jgi:ribosomal protein S18 acetylase RimI-like enzyme
MADVVLVPMTDQERDAFIRQEVADYAEQLADDETSTPEEAEDRAREELPPLLRQEHATADAKGHRRWTATTPGGESVGWLWVTPPRAGMPDNSAFLYQITVKSKQRRQGYARAMLAAAESALAADGIAELRLNTFDTNEAAQRLYAGAGYEIVEPAGGKRQLRKSLRQTTR